MINVESDEKESLLFADEFVGITNAATFNFVLILPKITNRMWSALQSSPHLGIC